MEQPIILKQRYILSQQPTHKAGAYGSILKAFDKQTQQFVAIKQVKNAFTQQGVSPSTLREITMLQSMKECQYIINMIQYFSENKKFYIVLPYIDVDLRQFMHSKYQDRVPLPLVKKIMFQLLTAVAHSHFKHVMHRDIKPQNILVLNHNSSKDMSIKLADWGSSRYLNRSSTANQQFTVEVIPLPYRPPQLLFECQCYTQSVDVWSIGCLFAQLLFGQRIFQSKNENSLLYQIIQKIGVNNENDVIWLCQQYNKHNYQMTSQYFQQFKTEQGKVLKFPELNKQNAAYDLVKKMLKIHPSKRIEARNALKHPYFQDN